MKKVLVIFLAVLSFPLTSSANKLCPKAETTLDISNCLSVLDEKADRQLNKYLKAAKKRYKEDSLLVKKIDKSQKAWIQYRDTHCDAVYQSWIEGSMRNIAYPTCVLYTTKQRTYDIWREYLTYMDSTKPVLPKPKLLLYQK